MEIPLNFANWNFHLLSYRIIMCNKASNSPSRELFATLLISHRLLTRRVATTDVRVPGHIGHSLDLINSLQLLITRLTLRGWKCWSNTRFYVTLLLTSLKKCFCMYWGLKQKRWLYVYIVDLKPVTKQDRLPKKITKLHQ